jgi:hypothetical protein
LLISGRGVGDFLGNNSNKGELLNMSGMQQLLVMEETRMGSACGVSVGLRSKVIIIMI